MMILLTLYCNPKNQYTDLFILFSFDTCRYTPSNVSILNTVFKSNYSIYYLYIVIVIYKSHLFFISSLLFKSALQVINHSVLINAMIFLLQFFPEIQRVEDK